MSRGPIRAVKLTGVGGGCQGWQSWRGKGEDAHWVVRPRGHPCVATRTGFPLGSPRTLPGPVVSVGWTPSPLAGLSVTGDDVPASLICVPTMTVAGWRGPSCCSQGESGRLSRLLVCPSLSRTRSSVRVHLERGHRWDVCMALGSWAEAPGLPPAVPNPDAWVRRGARVSPRNLASWREVSERPAPWNSSRVFSLFLQNLCPVCVLGGRGSAGLPPHPHPHPRFESR